MKALFLRFWVVCCVLAPQCAPETRAQTNPAPPDAAESPKPATQTTRASTEQQQSALRAIRIAGRQFGLGNAGAALQAWAPDAPGRAAFSAMVRDFSAGNDRAALEPGRLSGWSADAQGRVRVEMQFVLKWWETDALPLQAEQTWKIEFAASNGQLVIARLDWPLLELHAALQSAKTDAERRAALAASPVPLSPAVVSLLRWMAQWQPAGASIAAIEASNEEAEATKNRAIADADLALERNRFATDTAARLPGAQAHFQIGLCQRQRARLLQIHPRGEWHVANAPLRAALDSFEKARIASAPNAATNPTVSQALEQESVTRRAFSAWWLAMDFGSQSKSQAQIALGAARRAGDPAQQIESLIWQGEVARRQLDWDVARGVWNEALALSRRAGNASANVHAASRALTRLGDAAGWNGDYARATTFYSDAGAAARQIGSERLEAAALRGQTRLALATGRADDAAIAIEAALRRTRSFYLAEYVETMLLWGDSIALQVAVAGGDGRQQEIVNQISKIARIYLVLLPAISARGQSYEAMNALNETAPHMGRTVILLHSATQNMAETREMMALITFKTLGLLESTLEMERNLGNQLRQAQITNTLAGCRLAAQQPGAALPLFRAALQLAVAAGDAAAQVQALQGEGDVLRTLKQWQGAASAYRKAIAKVELVRAQARETTLQTGVLQLNNGPYAGLLECLRHLDTAPETLLEASEMAHARALVEVLRGGRVEVVKQMTGAEIRAEKRLFETETRLQWKLSEAMKPKTAFASEISTTPNGATPNGATPNGARDAKPDDVRRELSRARAATEAFRRELFLRHPQLSARRAEFKPASLEAIQSELFGQKPRRAIAVYSVGESDTLLFTLRPGAAKTAQLTLHRLPVGRSALGQRVRALTRALSRPSSVNEDFSELRALLLGPLETEITQLEELIIIPDGPLAALPFAALNDENGEFLLSRCAVSYAPGVAAILEMNRLQHARSNGKPTLKNTAFLAMSRSEFAEMGLKPLPGTSAEVAAIAPLFANDALVRQGEAATKSAALRAMPRAKWIHFATHGLLNQAAPLYSSVALSPDAPGGDGRLYARDLMGLELGCQLVVLSACETALGQEVRGEGILGLTWALFVAGAPTSVVTQWSVDDAATSALMPIFYGHLKDGQSPATAMRSAQLALLQGRATRHPAYWAPFIVVGAGN